MRGVPRERRAISPAPSASIAIASRPEERDTIEDVLEPFLIQQGYLQRTPRGRMATALTYRHFGLAGGPEPGGGLFG